MECKKCHKIIDNDSTFCTYCSAKQEVSTGQSKSQNKAILKKQCCNPDCPAEIKIDDNFCIECGTKQPDKEYITCCYAGCSATIEADVEYCIHCGTRQPVKNYTNGNLEPFRKDDFWGFRDKDTQDTVVGPKYDRVSKFVDNEALVWSKGRCALIDQNGTLLLSLKYEEIKKFRHGVYKVRSGDKWGLLDNKYEEITSVKYDEIENFDKNLLIASSDGKFSLLNNKGQKVTESSYDSISEFSDKGLAKVKRDNKYGLLDKTGKVLLPCKYYQLGDIEDGLAKISAGELHGFIDKNGEVVIPCRYREIRVLAHGVLAVKEKNKWNCLDSSGNNISDSSNEFLRFLKGKKRKRIAIRTLLAILALSVVLIYDYETTDIGIVRTVQVWVLGEDEMDWRDAISNVSIFETAPLEDYLEKQS